MDHYHIDRPDNCDTWFLWQGEEVIRTGSPATIVLELCRRLGLKAKIRNVLPSEEWPEIPVLRPITHRTVESEYEREMRDAGRQHLLPESWEER